MSKVRQLLGRFRSRLRGGPRVVYWREVVRPRVLSTPPVVGLTDASVEVHVATSANDWMNLTWVLKSFYLNSGRRYRLCIHDDGTIQPGDLATLRSHFPEARVIARGEADRTMDRVLEPYPRSRHFRATNRLSLKVFDLNYFLESPRMMLLDSDILFFREPTELLRRLEDPGYTRNTLNQDWGNGYSLSDEVVREHVPFLAPMINSGLGLIHRGSIRFDWTEEFLTLPGIINRVWCIEQTLIALCSSRFGYEHLPQEYNVHVGPEREDPISRHYTGPIRHRMYDEGIRRLVRSGFLEQVRRAWGGAGS